MLLLYKLLKLSKCLCLLSAVMDVDYVYLHRRRLKRVQLDVLEYIHDKEYVHADIKASNLLIGYTDPKQVTLNCWANSQASRSKLSRVFKCPQIFSIIIIIIDNKILNFLDCILIQSFHLENVISFHWCKNGGHFERRDTINMFINTLIFGEILPACTKEYLTAATYYCQVEVKV